MADNRTELTDLQQIPASTGELNEGEMASIAGGQAESQRLTIIDTIHSDNSVTADCKECPA